MRVYVRDATKRRTVLASVSFAGHLDYQMYSSWLTGVLWSVAGTRTGSVYRLRRKWLTAWGEWCFSWCELWLDVAPIMVRAYAASRGAPQTHPGAKHDHWPRLGSCPDASLDASGSNLTLSVSTAAFGTSKAIHTLRTTSRLAYSAFIYKNT
jgi:hypothetical protein